MAGFGDAPLVAKIAVALVCLGFVLNTIGFGAPYWKSWEGLGRKFNSGLWQLCTHSTLLDTSTCAYYTDVEDTFDKDNSLPDWLQATRVFEAIGFIATVATLVFVIIYICVSNASGSKIVAILLALCAFGACGTIMIGVITYGANVDVDYLSWGFALSTVGGIMFGIAGLLFIVSMCAK